MKTFAPPPPRSNSLIVSKLMGELKGTAKSSILLVAIGFLGIFISKSCSKKENPVVEPVVEIPPVVDTTTTEPHEPHVPADTTIEIPIEPENPSIATPDGTPPPALFTINIFENVMAVNYNSVKYSIGYWVVVGDSGTILMYDPYASRPSWQSKTSGTAHNLNDILYVNSAWMAVGHAGTIIKSSDFNGDTWTAQTSNTTQNFNGIAAANSNRIIAVGNNGTILYSNGTTWTVRASRTTKHLNSVAHKGGSTSSSIFCAVGDAGTILLSYGNDGAAWTEAASGTGKNLNSVAYINSAWVAVGNAGTILTSTDGNTWTARTSGITQNLNEIISRNNTYVAVGDAGTILTSSDCITWTAAAPDTTEDLRAVCAK